MENCRAHLTGRKEVLAVKADAERQAVIHSHWVENAKWGQILGDGNKGRADNIYRRQGRAWASGECALRDVGPLQTIT